MNTRLTIFWYHHLSAYLLLIVIIVDPFEIDEETAVGPDGLIHIRVQTRKGRKKVTTVTGLNSRVDLNAVVKRVQKVCLCFTL